MRRLGAAVAMLAVAAGLGACDDDVGSGCDIQAEYILESKPPAGYSLVPLSAREMEEALRRFASGAAGTTATRVVEHRGDRVAVAFVASDYGADDWKEDLQELPGSTEPKPVDLGTQTGFRVVLLQDGVLVDAVVGSYGCAAFAVMGRAERHVLTLARALAATAP